MAETSEEHNQWKREYAATMERTWAHLRESRRLVDEIRETRHLPRKRHLRLVPPLQKVE